ncbi:helix-turn-helix transcriptional regulator [Streptomyces sp. FH025]|uniref:helix-turn-helix domain-containing protein n=1 Tax=Streptomyces sp. FH025 TaxID=2815937 RepID=UPI001A9FB25A|nr:helix-turn-helix transcriptional regulator [Streptomyces sp. FH025]MBO1414190.1 helix-turn-helix domain-containing protein [Streptomyces sp. FH025]
MCRLRAFKAWSGNPSLRELERRTGLPRSTLSGDMSPQRSRLPPLARVLALATAFGAPTEELTRWRAAWQRIQVRQQSVEPPAPTPLAASPLDVAATTGDSSQIKSPVTKGDTLVVTLILAGAGTGPITVRDTAGNRYRAIRAETNDGTRLTVFTLFDAMPPDSPDRITSSWPSP